MIYNLIKIGINTKQIFATCNPYVSISRKEWWSTVNITSLMVDSRKLNPGDGLHTFSCSCVHRFGESMDATPGPGQLSKRFPNSGKGMANSGLST